MISRQKEKILFVVAVIVLICLGAFQFHKFREKDLPLTDQEEDGASSSTRQREDESSEEEICPGSEGGAGKKEKRDSEGGAEEKDDLLCYVHVDGAVQRPGLYILNFGARVSEAIEKAGGLTADADLSSVNLAMKLADEMKITIPNKASSAQEENQEKSWIDQPGQPKNPLSDESSRKKNGGGPKININQASKEELMALPSIGPSRAEEIISYREEHPFKAIEEIKDISGIGEKTFEKLKDRIQVH